MGGRIRLLFINPCDVSNAEAEAAALQLAMQEFDRSEGRVMHLRARSGYR
jgi:hypothetical protein